MGIGGLLKGLQFCTEKGHIKDFKGQPLAVDASSWLHKSVYSISEYYVEAYERKQIDQKCINVSANYIFKRCQELFQFADIAEIFLVMDGKRCPLKAVTNDDRERRRVANLEEAREYKRQGQPDKAEEKYKACIKIGDELTTPVLRVVERRFLNSKKPVHLVWSPYEADAQLVKVCRDGLANAIITEDSDVLVYLATSHVPFPVLFKLDRSTGQCDVISMDWLLNPAASEQRSEAGRTKKIKNPGIEQFTDGLILRQSKSPGKGVRMFVQACVLTGCDYCPSLLNGVGLVTAFKLVCENASRLDRGKNVFQGILSSLPSRAKKNIDVKEYELLLSKSEAVFYFHPVIDKDKRIRPLLSPLRNDADERQFFPNLDRFEGDWSFLGEMHDVSATDENYNAAEPIQNSPTLLHRKKLSPKVPRRCPGSSTSHFSVDSQFPPPITEITVPGKPEKVRLPASQKATAYDVNEASDKATADIMKMFQVNIPAPIRNPYEKKVKTRGGKAAVLTSAKSKSDPNQPKLSTSYFSQFAHIGKENNNKASVTSLMQRKDVRSVRRVFSKDGTGTKPMLQPLKTLMSKAGNSATMLLQPKHHPENRPHWKETRSARPPPADPVDTTGDRVDLSKERSAEVVQDCLFVNQQFDYGDESDGDTAVSVSSLNPFALSCNPAKKQCGNRTELFAARCSGGNRPFKGISNAESSPQLEITEKLCDRNKHSLEPPSAYPKGSLRSPRQSASEQTLECYKYREEGSLRLSDTRSPLESSRYFCKSRRVTMETPDLPEHGIQGGSSSDNAVDLSVDTFDQEEKLVESPNNIFDYTLHQRNSLDPTLDGLGSPSEELDSPESILSRTMGHHSSGRLTGLPLSTQQHQVFGQSRSQPFLQRRNPLKALFDKQQQNAASSTMEGLPETSCRLPYKRAANPLRSVMQVKSKKQKSIRFFMPSARPSLSIMIGEKDDDDF